MIEGRAYVVLSTCCHHLVAQLVDSLVQVVGGILMMPLSVWMIVTIINATRYGIPLSMAFNAALAPLTLQLHVSFISAASAQLSYRWMLILVLKSVAQVCRRQVLESRRS